MRHGQARWLLVALALVMVSDVSMAAKSTVDFWWGEALDWGTEPIREIISDFNDSQSQYEVIMSEHGYIGGTHASVNKLKVTVAGGALTPYNWTPRP